MPECHKCPHAPAVAAGKFAGVRWDKVPCATCKLTDEPNHKGRSHVSRDSSGAVDAEESRAVPAEYSGSDSFRRCDLEAGLRVLLTILDDAPETGRIILFRISHPMKPLKVIAGELGISVQAAHSRLRRACRKWPELSAVVAYRGRT
jgi:hypothetical protein